MKDTRLTQEENEKLLQKSLSRPGVADLMKLVESIEQTSDGAAVQYETYVLSASTTSPMSIRR